MPRYAFHVRDECLNLPLEVELLPELELSDLDAAMLIAEHAAMAFVAILRRGSPLVEALQIQVHDEWGNMLWIVPLIDMSLARRQIRSAETVAEAIVPVDDHAKADQEVLKPAEAW